MDRLTMTSDKGGLAFTFDLDVTCKRREMDKIVALGERLKAYEDAEEQGLLVRLACKVDDEMFSFRWSIKNQKHEMCTGKVKNVRYDSADSSVTVSDGEYYRVLGKTVFLTREEAKAALEGQK